jgi:hypothetical protein
VAVRHQRPLPRPRQPACCSAPLTHLAIRETCSKSSSSGAPWVHPERGRRALAFVLLALEIRRQPLQGRAWSSSHVPDWQETTFLYSRVASKSARAGWAAEEPPVAVKVLDCFLMNTKTQKKSGLERSGRGVPDFPPGSGGKEVCSQKFEQAAVHLICAPLPTWAGQRI